MIGLCFYVKLKGYLYDFIYIFVCVSAPKNPNQMFLFIVKLLGMWHSFADQIRLLATNVRMLFTDFSFVFNTAFSYKLV